MEIKKDGFTMYVPDNHTGPIDTVIYYPGAGGAGNDAGAMRNYVASNPDKIVIISQSCSAGNASQIYSALDEVQSTSSIQINDLNFLGHSAGQNSAVDVAAQAYSHGYNVNYIVSLDSAESASGYYRRGPEAKVLAEHGAKLIMFDQRMTPIEYRNLQPFNEAGLPIVYVFCGDGSTNFYENHAHINEGTVNDGIIDLICGDSTTLKDSQYFNYHYMVFDSEKNDWVTISKSEAEAMMRGQPMVVMSDDEYIAQETSKLKGSVSGSSLTEVKNLSLSNGSTTKYPRIDKDIYNTLIGAIRQLNSNITAELSAIVAAGLSYKELDNKLAKQALSQLPSMPKIAGLDGTDVSMKNPPKDGWNNGDYVVSQKDIRESMYEITADDLDRLFTHWAEERHADTAPLIGLGKYFIDAATKYNVDPMVLVSICAHETGYGVSQNAMPKMNNHNFFGQLYTYKPDGSGSTYWGSTVPLYDSDEEAIDASVYRISKFYIDEHHAGTLEELARLYNGDENDDQYVSNLKSIYVNQLKYILETDPRNPNNEGKNLPAPNATAPKTTGQTQGTTKPTTETNKPESNVPSSGGYSGGGGGAGGYPAGSYYGDRTSQKPSEGTDLKTVVETVEEAKQETSTTPVATVQRPVSYDYKEEPVSIPKEEEIIIESQENITHDNEEIEFVDQIPFENEPTDITDTTTNVESNNENSTTKKILTAAGITAAVAGAAGAAMYGIKKTRENNEIDEETVDDDDE